MDDQIDIKDCNIGEELYNAAINRGNTPEDAKYFQKTVENSGISLIV